MKEPPFNLFCFQFAPHLWHCCLLILTPPSSPLLFISTSPLKFAMFTPSVTCLSKLSLCTPVTFIVNLVSAPPWYWGFMTFYTYNAPLRNSNCDTHLLKCSMLNTTYKINQSDISNQITESLSPKMIFLGGVIDNKIYWFVVESNIWRHTSCLVTFEGLLFWKLCH